jgi:hypothetical protein
MKRNRFTSRKRISADATELSRLAIGLAESGSKLEDLFWQNRLAELVDKLFHDGAEDDFTGSLDRLFDTHAMAHDDLADTIEAHAESCVLSHLGQEFDILLFAAPLLAWSRFSIPTVPRSPRSLLQTLKVHLGAHVFAAGARLALADYLYSPDQLPHSFVDTWQLMQQLGSAAMAGSDLNYRRVGMPETNRFLSDTRYLVGALAVRRGQPLFRWNEADKSTRESALKEWLKQGGPCFEALLTGCAYEPLLADAYHAACRAADSASRPYSLNASVAFSAGHPRAARRQACAQSSVASTTSGSRSTGSVSARKDSDVVFHGVVWPLLGIEDETTDVAGEIETALRKSGIKDVVALDQQFPYEFCDDCGAPLYPNIDGDTVHAEMPEQNNAPSQTLH